MQKRFIFLVLFVYINILLTAQSSSNFAVHSAGNIGNFNTWNDFVNFSNNISIEWERINNSNAEQSARFRGSRHTTYTIWLGDIKSVNSVNKLDGILDIDKSYNEVDKMHSLKCVVANNLLF